VTVFSRRVIVRRKRRC